MGMYEDNQRINRDAAHRHEREQRVQRELNANKREPGGAGPGTGKAILVVLALLVVGSIVRSAVLAGARGWENLRATEVVERYGFGQYLLNVVHGHEAGLLRVKGEPLPCYAKQLSESELAGAAPVTTLATGQGFLLRGYDPEGDSTWVAAEVRQGEKPVYCLVRLAEESKEPLLQEGSSKLVEPHDAKVAMALLHAEFWMRATQEPELVAVKLSERERMRKYERAKGYARVSPLVVPPRAIAKGRSKTEYFLPEPKVAWLEKLRGEYLSWDRIWEEAMREDPAAEKAGKRAHQRKARRP